MAETTYWRTIIQHKRVRNFPSHSTDIKNGGLYYGKILNKNVSGITKTETIEKTVEGLKQLNSIMVLFSGFCQSFGESSNL